MYVLVYIYKGYIIFVIPFIFFLNIFIYNIDTSNQTNLNSQRDTFSLLDSAITLCAAVF